MKFANCFSRKFSCQFLALAASCCLFILLVQVVSAEPPPKELPPKAPQSKDAASSDADLAEQEAKIEKDASTEINVRNADIASIIRIFSKKTKRNYILDDRVKGKVSIYLPGKVSNQDSIRILDSVLAYKGFSAVPIGENLWKVIPAKEARQSTIPTVLEDELAGSSASIITRLVNLKFIAADDAKQVLAQLVSPDGFINSYATTNSLIIIDNEDNIARLMGILENIDVSASDRDMTIIPIENADAVDIAAKLNELLGTGDKGDKSGASDLLNRNSNSGFRQANLQRNNANAPAGQPANGDAPGEQQSVGSNVALVRQPKIIADERTNSIILVADETTTARVQALISQLDSKIDLSGLRFYVYRCQYAKAEELTDVIAGLVGEGSGKGGNSRSTSSNISGNNGDLISGGGGSSGNSRDGLTNSRSNRSSRSQDRVSGQTRTPGRSRSENKNSNQGAKSVELGDNFSISADPATNTLIIFGSKAQYDKMKLLLQTLDVKRRQVLVEAMLLEVGLQDEDRLKSSFLVSGGGADGGIIAQSFGSDILGLLSNPSGVQDFSIAAASAGTLTIGGGSSEITIPSQTLLLSAIQRNTNVNILSAPTLLATNNEPAEIVVGQNVPFVASTSTDGSNLSNTFNQIDRQDVGITLRLTPQISSRDSVTLSIFTEVSNVVSTDPTLGPTTSVRTSETSVITKDGQMIVTGGLMSDDTITTDAGVPFLMDVPVLGHLFRFSNDIRRRTNLLILITPRIVKDQYDARDITIENRDVMEREIDHRDIHPDRREILRDRAIDRVSESEPYDGMAPSTVLPPKDLTSEFKNSEQAANSIKSPVQSGEQVMEFNVNPKLPPKPKFEKETSSKATATTSNKSAIANNTAVANNTVAKASMNLPSSDSFIVVELISDKDTKNNLSALPFKLSNAKHLGTLRIPAEAKNSVLKLFQTGSKVGYQIGGKSTQFRVVGEFPNANEAKLSFPDIGSQWYELSPYEIMKVGVEPWIQVN